MNLLLQRYNEDLEIEDAIHTALLTLREGFEGEVSDFSYKVMSELVTHEFCVMLCVSRWMKTILKWASSRTTASSKC